MRIIFAGTPQFAATILQGLLNGPHDIIAVYTQPDKQAGRGQQLQASEVKQLAEQHQIPVYQPSTLRDSTAQQELSALKPDLMVVAAYGMLLPQVLLDLPRLGCLNVHASLLPKWRGAAPIARAIEAGDLETGVSMMQMVAALDAGPVWEMFPLKIEQSDTHSTLSEKLSALAAEHINDTIDKIAKGNIKAIPQDEAQSSYASKLSKAEALIDWSRSANDLARQVRAFNPWPVSYTYIEDQLVRVWAAEALSEPTDEKPGTLVHLSEHGFDVATGKGILRLQEVQLAGKPKMRASELYKTRHPLFKPGLTFSSQ